MKNDLYRLPDQDFYLNILRLLVNNVGKSYDSPVFFQELPDQDLADIVEINMLVICYS